MNLFVEYSFFFSVLDIDYCTGANYACSNGGSCVDGISNYSCSCLAGYTGDHCERGKFELVSSRESMLGAFFNKLARAGNFLIDAENL